VLQWLPVLVYVMLYPVFVMLLILGCWWALCDLAQQEVAPYTCAFLVAAVCSLTTLGLGCAGTVRHFFRVAETPEAQYDTGTRERVGYILALPPFFALMCFMCVVQSIQLKLGTADRHWCRRTCEEYDREAFSRDMMNFYTAAADLFEGFALWQFGRLIMAAVKKAEQRRMGAAAAEDNALMEVLRETMMFPLYVLSGALYAQSVHRFFYTLLEYFKFKKVLECIFPLGFAAKFQEWLGADPDGKTESLVILMIQSLASTFAVYYLKLIEARFHAKLVEVDFIVERGVAVEHSWQGFALSFCSGVLESKFWGVKIIVSAEAGLVLMKNVIAWIRTVDDDLARAWHNSVMTVVCLFVAVIHKRAYQPRGAWIVGLSPPADSQLAVAVSTTNPVAQLAASPQAVLIPPA